MATRLLNGVEATGAGGAVKVSGSKHTVSTWFTNSGGGVTVLVVGLEGSVDNSKWYTLYSYTFDAADLVAKQAAFCVVNKPVEFVRVNLTTLTETGTTAVYSEVLTEK